MPSLLVSISRPSPTSLSTYTPRYWIQTLTHTSNPVSPVSQCPGSQPPAQLPPPTSPVNNREPYCLFVVPPPTHSPGLGLRRQTVTGFNLMVTFGEPHQGSLVKGSYWWKWRLERGRRVSVVSWKHQLFLPWFLLAAGHCVCDT